jgi:hypothetical protein
MTAKWEAPQAHRTGPPSAEACKKECQKCVIAIKILLILQSKQYS